MVELPLVLPDNQLAYANGCGVRVEQTCSVVGDCAVSVVLDLNEDGCRRRVLARYAAEVRRDSIATLSRMDERRQRVICVAPQVDMKNR